MLKGCPKLSPMMSCEQTCKRSERERTLKERLMTAVADIKADSLCRALYRSDWCSTEVVDLRTVNIRCPTAVQTRNGMVGLSPPALISFSQAFKCKSLHRICPFKNWLAQSSTKLSYERASPSLIFSCEGTAVHSCGKCTCVSWQKGKNGPSKLTN